MPDNLFSRLYSCLMETNAEKKVLMTYQCLNDWENGLLELVSAEKPVLIPVPGRPLRPLLVDPKEVPGRGIGSEEGRNILAHAIAHIEFNAINLALDAAYRFRDMPSDFYTDWLRVARDEAYHFTLVAEYLQTHGVEYGKYSAHNGLWEMALKTTDNVLERMALVPRVLEARGLDVTPGMIIKLEKVGDTALVNCLKIIHKEEIGHVAVGTRWFHYACEKQGVDARTTFIELIKSHVKNAVRGPFDEISRMEAGFSAEEMADLKILEAGLKQ
jgi:uncharacterized ferritin-like protein (DUF455 family)